MPNIGRNIGGDLINGKYDLNTGAVHFKYGTEYLDYNFGLSPANVITNAPSWAPGRGQYNNLICYWIWKPNERKCWQAVKCNGPLVYWNQDGLAKGNPQDWELFQLVDAGGNRVFIMNVYGRYVKYNGPSGRFECTGAGQGDAAMFEALIG